LKKVKFEIQITLKCLYQTNSPSLIIYITLHWIIWYFWKKDANKDQMYQTTSSNYRTVFLYIEVSRNGQSLNLYMNSNVTLL